MFCKSRVSSQNIIDLHNCQIDLNDIGTVQSVMSSIIDKYRLTSIKTIYQQFPKQGITYIDILTESHLIIHTWPEIKYASIDLFSCSKKIKVDKNWFKNLFKCKKIKCSYVKHNIT